MRRLTGTVFAVLLAAATTAAQLPPNDPERPKLLAEHKRLTLEGVNALLKMDRPQAIKILEARLVIEQKLYGPTSPEVENTLSVIADFSRDDGDYAGVARARKRLADLAAKRHGAKHWKARTAAAEADTAAIVAKLTPAQHRELAAAEAEYQAGMKVYNGRNPADAVPMFRWAAAETKRVVGTNTTEYAAKLQVLGLSYMRVDQYAAAEKAFVLLVKQNRAVYGEPHPDTTINTYFLGTVYRKRGMPGPAEPLLVRSLRDARELVKDGGVKPDLFFSWVRGLSSFYLELEDTTAAAPYLREAREMARKEYGKQSDRYINTLTDAALFHTLRFEFAEAEAAVNEAAGLAPQVYKPNNPELARVTYRRAELYRKTGRYARAAAELTAALAMLAKADPPSPSQVISCNNELGLVYLDLGKPRLALPCFERAVALGKQLYGEDNPQYAALLHNLALGREKVGEFPEAEKLYIRALEIKQARDPDSLDAAITLENLGSFYLAAADYARAEPPLLKALAIRTKLKGENHPVVLSTFNELGVLYLDKGDYRRAEPFLRRAAEQRQKILGTHPDTARSLDNYAKLLAATGNLGRAAEYYREALRIRRAVLPEGHPDLATGVNNLATVYGTVGLWDKAEPLFREAVKILEAADPVDRPALAHALDNLGSVAEDLKRLEEADKHLARALAIWEEVAGMNPGRRPHPGVATTLGNLAGVRWRQNKKDEALDLSKQSIKVRRETLGPTHPLLARALLNYASLLRAAGRPDEAAAALEEALQIDQELIGEILGFSSEREMLNFSFEVQGGMNLLLTLATDRPDDRARVERTLGWVIRRKGMVLDALCRYRGLEARLERDPALAAQVREYRGLRQQLVDHTLNPGPSGEPVDVKGLQVRVDALQAAINRRLADEQPAPKAAAIDLARVRAALPRGAALVEYVHVWRPELRGSANPGEHRYAAFVLTADPAKPPRLFDLGAAEEVEAAVAAVRKRLAPFNRDETKEEVLYKREARALYEKVLNDPAAAFSGCDTLLVSPDGALNHVPFAALVGPDGRYLIESYRVAVLPSTRDLLRPRQATSGKGVVVFANPDFDLAPTLRARKGGPPGLVATRGADVGFRAEWSELKGTGEEAEAIRAALSGAALGTVRVFERDQATEEEAKAVRSPRVLHFATHGRFVEKVAGLAATDLRTPGSRAMAADNPLLRSAIALAGANRPPAGGSRTEDGLLTAEEAALLDLRGTDLVVLSACESGLGEVKDGEGVYGLRRAFLYAGARAVVATLYKIPDKETAGLVGAFYTGLAAGKGKLDALHAAQLAAIAARRGESKDGPAHPLYWAGFILIGDRD